MSSPFLLLVKRYCMGLHHTGFGMVVKQYPKDTTKLSNLMPFNRRALRVNTMPEGRQVYVFTGIIVNITGQIGCQY